MGPYFQDVYDHVLRATEWTESLRDLVSSVAGNQLNDPGQPAQRDHERVTSWAAIIAVSTAITGFYGQKVPDPGFSRTSGIYASTLVNIALSSRAGRVQQGPRVLVAKQVIRQPSWSVSRSWAPGCGRSRRAMTRIPAGQCWGPNRAGERVGVVGIGIQVVSSATWAPSRGLPSESSAARHACGGMASIAALTVSRAGNPIEYSNLASACLSVRRPTWRRCRRSPARRHDSRPGRTAVGDVPIPPPALVPPRPGSPEATHRCPPPAP
jgi:CorA-like Mg2+ transporter protein